MTDSQLQAETSDIVVEQVLPHPPEAIWHTLTSPEMIRRWIMPPTGFAAVEGTEFTYQTKPGGAWDGVIHCTVLKVRPNECLSYRWRGGHPDNESVNG